MEKEKQNEENRSSKKKRSNIISNIILLAAVCVFLYAGYNLWQIFSEYNKGTSEYDAIFDQAITLEVPDVTDGAEEEEEAEKEIFKVDFDKLKSINSDVIGWIRFENPEQINYPVVYGVDNEKYLKKTFEGKTNAAGAIFTDMINEKDFNDQNTFIYGHNMKNGSMFAMLRKYKSVDFYKENPYFYIYTPDGREMKYQIFSVAIVEDPSESYTKQYTSDAAFENYLKYIKSVSLYDTGVAVESTSRIVSLSTCTNVTDSQRLLVHAVRISVESTDEQEPTFEE